MKQIPLILQVGQQFLNKISPLTNNLTRRVLPLYSFSTLSSKQKSSLEYKQLSYQFNQYFAKVGKKKQERLDKEKERSESNLSKSIDLNIVEKEFQQDIEAYKTELSKLKTGRLSPESFEKFTVQAYGEKAPITELAQIVPKSITTVILNVYDETLTSQIYKALENSELGFQLKKDQKQITCTLVGGNTKEMKENIIRQAKKVADNYKQKFRKNRQKGLDLLKPFKKFSSEDVIKEAEVEIGKIHEKNLELIEELLKAKEKEIMK